MENIPNEGILPDDYPVYGDYWYVVDGKPMQSNWQVRRCNIIYRHKRNV